MAYNCWYSGNNIASEQDCLDATVSGFEACGWTVADSFTNGSFPTKVFTSQGEDGQYRTVYIECWHENANMRVFVKYHIWWDDVSHTGEGSGYFSAGYCNFQFDSGYPVTFYGNKNVVVIYTTSSITTYYTRTGVYAYLDKYDDARITLTQAATSGDDSVLTVSGSLDRFETDRSYIIMGDITEGRDPIFFDTISGTTTGAVTVTNLPRNYAAGAIIEHTPCAFVTHTYNNWKCLSSYEFSGLEDAANTNYNFTSILPIGQCDPDTNTNRYILQPLFFTEDATSGYAPVGYLTCSGIAYQPLATAVPAYDASTLYTMGDYESGSSTSSSTSTSLNDTSKSWTTNEHSGKVFVFTNAVAGNGEGQTRVISSNTSNTLYWNNPLHTIPTTSDEYRIYDGEIWRQVAGLACRELIY